MQNSIIHHNNTTQNNNTTHKTRQENTTPKEYIYLNSNQIATCLTEGVVTVSRRWVVVLEHNRLTLGKVPVAGFFFIRQPVLCIADKRRAVGKFGFYLHQKKHQNTQIIAASPFQCTLCLEPYKCHYRLTTR